MLEVLLESEGVRAPRPVAGAVISAGVHAALVFVFLVAGHRVVRDLTSVPDGMLEFLMPTDRRAPSPAEKINYVAVGSGEAKSGVAIGAKKLEERGEFALPEIAGVQNEPAHPPVAQSDPQAADNAYSVLDVDSAAVRDPSSAAPAYPPVMMAKSIEGSAAMRFVVDSSGRIDMGTVELLTATHPEFAQAVREAMPHMRFRPAKMGPSAVRQLAEQLFKFEIRLVASSTEASPKKP